MTNLDSMLKSRDIALPTKVHIVKATVVMYDVSWTTKNDECQRIDVFKLWCWRGLLRVLLDSKEIKPINFKGNQPRISIGRTDAEAEAPILWSPDANGLLSRKDPVAGKD